MLRSYRRASSARSRGAGTKTFAHLRPGRLKVLLGAVQTMQFRAKDSPSEAKGMCRQAGFMIRSWWISSEITSTPWRAQISPMARSSASVQTLPVGLCGLHRMKILVFGLIAASKAASSNR